MSGTPLSPALRLLIACARWPRSDARNEGVRRAAAEIDDWSAFPLMVERHRMAPLALDGLRHAGVVPPPEVAENLSRAVRRDTRQVLASLADTIEVADLLGRAGIPMIVLKGVPLSVEAFGAVAMRQTSDLDLLVEPTRFLRARELLIDAGYEQIEPVGLEGETALAPWLRFHKDMTFRSLNGRPVELHHRLTSNPWVWPRQPRPDRCGSVELGGRTIPVLPEGDRLLYLCLHGAGDSWVRLKWLADIAALFAGKDDAAIASFHAHAEAAGLAMPAGQALLLLERVFGRSLPDDLRRRLHRDWRLTLLAAIAFHRLRSFRQPSSPVFGLTQFTVLLLMRRGWRCHAAEIHAALIDWPVATALGGSRAAIAASVVTRPLTWLAKKIRRERPAGAANP